MTTFFFAGIVLSGKESKFYTREAKVVAPSSPSLHYDSGKWLDKGLNAQMNYWPAEVCNLPECHYPLFDLIGGARREDSRIHDKID